MLVWDLLLSLLYLDKLIIFKNSLHKMQNMGEKMVEAKRLTTARVMLNLIKL